MRMDYEATCTPFRARVVEAATTPRARVPAYPPLAKRAHGVIGLFASPACAASPPRTRRPAPCRQGAAAVTCLFDRQGKTIGNPR